MISLTRLAMQSIYEKIFSSLIIWPSRFFVLFLQLPYWHHLVKGFQQVGQTYIRKAYFALCF